MNVLMEVKCRASLVLAVLVPLNLFALRDSLDIAIRDLDNAIAEHAVYDQIRENRINILKSRILAVPPNSIALYDLNQQIYLAYKPYICDSAVIYLNRNLAIATALGDNYRRQESALMLSGLLSSSGMYKEACDALNLIDRRRMPSYLTALYYETCDRLYSELASNTQYPDGRSMYMEIAGRYKDSLDSALPENSTQYLILAENRLRDLGKLGESLEMNDRRLEAYAPGSPGYALARFHRALTYRSMGDTYLYKLNLALSASSDISSAINDHASLWMLAEQLYSEGNVLKAYQYMRFSWDKTLKYNARLRNSQSSGVLSIIDDTFQTTIQNQNHKLKTYVWLVSVLAVMLVLALIFIYRQLRKLSVTQSELRLVNLQLTGLNDRLSRINIDLNKSNNALVESNQIKEEYIGRFIKLCSTYVDKLDSYRRMVNKKISNGQTRELLSMARSSEFIETTLDDLYNSFDKAFLNLFPDFVERFNALLAEGERISPKKEELLNTELRIFALIRLGIDDSAQIAEFLRYSVNTIYNYRAKVKNKASVNRDDFESMVKQIR